MTNDAPVYKNFSWFVPGLILTGAVVIAVLATAWASASVSVNVSASIPTLCGNNILEAPGEQCDGTALGGQTCVSRGYGGGALSCTDSCAFNESDCTAPVQNTGGGGGGGGGGFGGFFSPLPETSAVFSGRAYPHSRVILLKDGQVAVSAIAGEDATFHINLGDLTGGDYMFSLYGENPEGSRSSSFTFPVSAIPGVSTKIERIFIAPTIAVDKTEVRRGETISIFGQTAPYANVTIAVNSKKEFSEKTVADKNGAYLYEFDTTVLEDGMHFAKSKSEVERAASSFSDTVSFLVGDETVKTEPEHKVEKGDLDNDKRVNLADFSVAAFWFGRPSPPPAVDMDNNGKVDLVDFSIMAYNWTG